MPNVDTTSGEVVYQTLITREGRRRSGKVVGVDTTYFHLFNLKVAEGKRFAPMQVADGAPVAIIGHGVKTRFFTTEEPIGKPIKVGDVWLTVVGVLEDRKVSDQTSQKLGIRDANMDVYVPLSTMLLRYRNRVARHRAGRAAGVARVQRRPERDTPNEDADQRAERVNYHQLDRMIVRVTDAKYVTGVADVLQRMLSRRHNQVIDFEISVPELLLKQQQRTKNIFNVVLAAIASISLIVGGIGIMNIMLASILERIREIGVRRAVGASQRDILAQFLSEAVLISLAGGIAGIILGGAISFGIERIAKIHTIVSALLGVHRLRRVDSPSASSSASCPPGARRNRIRWYVSDTSELRGHQLSAISHQPDGAGAAGGLSVRCEAQQPLTLQQAIELAQKQGLQARAVLDARDAARWRDRAFNARLMPQLSLTGTLPNYERAIVPVIQPDGSTQFRPRQQTTSALGMTAVATAAVHRRLHVRLVRPLSGWTSAATSRRASTARRRSRSGSAQDIFRPNALKWDSREQDLVAVTADRQYLEAREDVAVNTANAFFDLFSARLALDNAASKVAINDTLYNLNKGRFEVGKIGENDLLQSELALLQARTSLDGAKLDFDRANAALKRLLSLPPDAPIEITAPTDVPLTDVDTALAVAAGAAKPESHDEHRARRRSRRSAESPKRS